jgi:hypothetical protein
VQTGLVTHRFPERQPTRLGHTKLLASNERIERARYQHRLRWNFDPVERWKHLVRLRLVAKVGPSTPRVEVQISIGFILLGLITGMSQGATESLTMLLILASAVFVQEFSRALLAYALGRSSKVVLSVAGGHTELPGPRLTGIRAWAFASVGSLSNLLVAGALLLHGTVQEPGSLGVRLAVCHGVWGLAQVLPLSPFRAGEVVADRLRPQGRFALAALSLALVGAALPFATEGHGAGFMVIALAGTGALHALARAYTESSDVRNGVEARTVEAYVLLQRGHARRAVEVASQALMLVRSAPLRTRLYQVLAWSAIAEDDAFETHRVLAELEPEAIDLHLLCAYLNSCQQPEEALELLSEARRFGHRSAELTKLHVDLLYRTGQLEGAAALAESDAALLSPSERAQIARAIATAS